MEIQLMDIRMLLLHNRRCRVYSKNGSCVLHFIEHVASLVGEFFSGGVCHKENGENCSSEAMRDGRLIHGNNGFGWFL